jgi:hypothetical protein
MIGRTEKVVLVLTALLLSSFCYLYGLLQPHAGTFYTGIRTLNASDYNVNLSWIQQFREGHFLLKNLYTAQLHNGFLVRPIYFLLSAPFAWIPFSNTLVLHLLRLLCGFALLWSLIPLLEFFTEDKQITRNAFLLLAFSSGIGVLFSSSADLNLPESVLFLTLGEPPHFLYSLLLLWGGIVSLYLTSKDSRHQWGFYLCLALLWWEHPFDAVILGSLAIATLWNLPAKQRWILLAGTLLISLSPALYYRALFKLPAYAGWSAQNVMTSPPFLSLLCAFLPLIVLAIPRVADFKNADPQKKRRLAFLLTWLLLQLVLAYIPVSFQRRLIAGVQFPLAVLAARTLNRWKSKIAPAMVILLVTATNVFVMMQETKALKNKDMPFYLPLSYKNMFDWMAAQKTKAPVLSGFITGNFIPGYTGFPVFAGHSALTPQIGTKRSQMIAFFKEPDSRFLLRESIAFVFWGLEEQRIGGPDLSLKLQPVHVEAPVTLLGTKTQRLRGLAAMTFAQRDSIGQMEQSGRIGLQTFFPCHTNKSLIGSQYSSGIDFRNANSVCSGVRVETQPSLLLMR